MTSYEFFIYLYYLSIFRISERIETNSTSYKNLESPSCKDGMNFLTKVLPLNAFDMIKVEFIDIRIDRIYRYQYFLQFFTKVTCALLLQESISKGT